MEQPVRLRDGDRPDPSVEAASSPSAHPCVGDIDQAEPAEFGLAFIAQFQSVSELWDCCDDNGEKFTGLIDRIEFWQGFDWKRSEGPQPGVECTEPSAG